MTGKFSKYLRKKKPIIKKLVDVLSNEYPYVSVLATDVSGTVVQVDRFTTYLGPSRLTESGFVIKVYHNSLYSELSINDISEKNFKEILEEIRELTSIKGSVPSVDAPLLEEEKIEKSFRRKSTGKVYQTEEIIEILNENIKEIENFSPLIVNTVISVESTEISKMFISKNKVLEQYYTWNNLNDYILVRRDNTTRYCYDGYGYNSMEKGFLHLKASLKETAETAIELLDATNPTPGFYDIITDPSITGLIAHEAFGHGVEMDMFVRERAKAIEYLDKQVASPLITMHDGAAACESVASYFFDDDGILAHDTKIIDQGILVNGISDSLTALELGTKATGNGRRESYKRKSYTRMTNTFFEAGNDDLEEMIKSIDYGYYIAKTNNGMEDPKNWGIQCTALYGKEIKDGKFTGKIITPVVMSGYVIDLLNSITAVSKDFKVIGSGSCGKGYKEWVRVSDGGPYLKAKVKIG